MSTRMYPVSPPLFARAPLLPSFHFSLTDKHDRPQIVAQTKRVKIACAIELTSVKLLRTLLSPSSFPRLPDATSELRRALQERRDSDETPACPRFQSYMNLLWDEAISASSHGVKAPRSAQPVNYSDLDVDFLDFDKIYESSV